jgi:hypothetical protein
MQGALGKNRSKHFKIDSGAKVDAGPVVSSAVAVTDDRAAVNLRYFQRSHECFSDWQNKELRAFSGFVEKMAGKTETQVTSITQTCHAHQGKPKKKLPQDVSADVKMYSLDVGPKGRVHGFFFSGTFFLVWLDREGAVLGH